MQVLEVGRGPVRQTPLLKIGFGDYDVGLEVQVYSTDYRWFETK